MGDLVDQLEHLKQENHDWKQKFHIARQMEVAYLEEIEQLRESLQSLSSTQVPSEKANLNSTCTSEWEERIDASQKKIASLQEELQLVREECVQLKERLSAAEYRLELSESSVSTLADVTHCVSVDEMARLKEELDAKEAQHRMELSRRERQVVELDEECCALRSENTELQRHLKELREEARDLRAQLEAVELQSNTAAQTRGNSAFSEIEDRRIRAEQLVKKQRQLIEELQSDIQTVKAEYKRKIQDEVQKQEIRFRERDTKFTDNLVAERQRLLAENRALNSRLQQMEELQIEQESRAVELSKAFNFEGKTQDNLIKTLEKRITQLQRRLTEKSSETESLREHVLGANLQRRQMQTELWRQMDLVAKLAEQLATLRQQNNVENTAHRSPIVNNEIETQGAGNSKAIEPPERGEADENTNPAGPVKAEVGDKLNFSSFIKQPTENERCINLDNLTTSQVKKNELPPECKTS